MANGSHIVADCMNVPAEVCVDDKRIMSVLVKAAFRSGANVIGANRYRFFGDRSWPGCSVFVILDESHVSVHAYADMEMMALDIFTCGYGADELSESIFKRVLNGLEIKNFNVKKFDRF